MRGLLGEGMLSAAEGLAPAGEIKSGASPACFPPVKSGRKRKPGITVNDGRAFSCPSWDRTRTLLIQSQACCQLHQGAKISNFADRLEP